MRWNECLAALILFHVAGAAVFRQTPYTYDRNDGKLRFIAKFGVKANAQFGLSGTFSNRTAENESIILALVSHETWTELDRLFVPPNDCNKLSNLTSKIAFRWPVPHIQRIVLKTITANNLTEYWYLVFLGCVPHSPWEDSGSTQFDYSVTLTNLPSDVLTQQFSYEMKWVVIVILVATCTYLALLAFQVVFSTYACACKKTRLHLLVKLFNLLLLLRVGGLGLQLVDLGLYTKDGLGVPAVKHIGSVLTVASDCLLVLLFLLISKGWQLTTAILHYRLVTFTLWGIYIIISTIFFAWTVVYQEMYPFTSSIESHYQTWAAWLYQAYRFLLLPYCLYEIWHCYRQENDAVVRTVYLFFVGSFVVWFGYLPVTVGVLYAVNPLEWPRVILSVVNLFDLGASAMLAILFCPLWSDCYFRFNSHLNAIVNTYRYTELKFLTR